MHVGEETFRVVRMNLVEYERVTAEIDEMVEENEIDVARDFPTLHRFFTAIGACTDDTTQVVDENDLAEDETADVAEIEGDE